MAMDFESLCGRLSKNALRTEKSTADAVISLSVTQGVEAVEAKAVLDTKVAKVART